MHDLWRIVSPPLICFTIYKFHILYPCFHQSIRSLVWAYLVGKHKDINIKPIRILRHRRKAKSIVKYGLEEISTILLRPAHTPKFDAFKFLSCT